ncbi:phenylalanine--tRNA ligase subunit beta [Candidatus Woesearchaeota archaeon]|nr:phenylalanine--tRNA ligase subunit beta [Candidatus Woesearchaeota archaeon]
MVKVEISHQLLNKVVGKTLLKEQLEETLFSLGYDLENVEGDLLTVDITAERPDLVSAAGLGRLLKAYLGLKKGLSQYLVKKSDYSIVINPNVKHIRPYTVAAVVRGLKLDDATIKELIRIQEKLHATYGRGRKKAAIGIYPLEKITWPITYFAEDPRKMKFVPLDFSESMSGMEILERHPTGITYKHLLQDLQQFAFFMDARKQVLSMPPIINAQQLGKVTATTKDVFIEVSGHDFSALNVILNILVALMHDMGGSIYGITLHYGQKKLVTPHLVAEKMQVPLKDMKKVLGLDLSYEQVKELLERMQYGVEKVDKEYAHVLVPPFRSDVWHAVDVLDDVARAYGFNNFKPIFTHVETLGGTTKRVQVQEEIIDLLVGLGMHQTMTFGLTNKDYQFAKMLLAEQDHIPLGKTAEESINMVRLWLLPELMKVLEQSRSRTYPQKLFEINYVVEPDKERDVVSKNVLKFAAVLCEENVTFTNVRQIVEYVLDKYHLPYTWKETEHPSFIPGRVAAVVVDEKEVGFCGELHPQVLEHFGLQMPVAGFELDIDKIFNL